MRVDKSLIDIAIVRMHNDPFDKDCRCILADMLEDRGKIWEPAALRAGLVPLTEIDKLAADNLYGCRIKYGPSKHFVSDIYAIAEKDHPSLTPRQWLWMWVLLHRFRRQVKHLGIKAIAAERYNRHIKLLDLNHIKPTNRQLTLVNYDASLNATMFDGEIP